MKPNAVADHARPMQALPQTETVSPVTAAELAAFLGVDATDPLLGGLLVSATDLTIQYINQDLARRKWVLKIGDNIGAEAQLSPARYESNIFELPYTALVSVLSVSSACAALDWEVVSTGRPAKIRLDGWDGITEVTITYNAGMAFIPTAIKTGIMMLAAFMYEHRGQCDGHDAIKRSGAANLLRPYRVEVVI